MRRRTRIVTACVMRSDLTKLRARDGDHSSAQTHTRDVCARESCAYSRRARQTARSIRTSSRRRARAVCDRIIIRAAVEFVNEPFACALL